MLIGIVCAMTGILVMYPYAGPTPPLKFINQTDSGNSIKQFLFLARNLKFEKYFTEKLTFLDVDSFSMWNFDVYELNNTLPSCYNASTALTDG